MNRQQAPQPVVRPLKRLSYSELLQKLETVERNQEVFCIVRNYYNNSDALVYFALDLNNKLNMSIIDCRNDGDDVQLVDPSNVVNECVVNELPCYKDSVSGDEVMEAGNNMLQSIVEGTNYEYVDCLLENTELYEEKLIQYVMEL